MKWKGKVVGRMGKEERKDFQIDSESVRVELLCNSNLQRTNRLARPHWPVCVGSRSCSGQLSWLDSASEWNIISILKEISERELFRDSYRKLFIECVAVSVDHSQVEWPKVWADVFVHTLIINWEIVGVWCGFGDGRTFQSGKVKSVCNEIKGNELELTQIMAYPTFDELWSMQHCKSVFLDD